MQYAATSCFSDLQTGLEPLAAVWLYSSNCCSSYITDGDARGAPVQHALKLLFVLLGMPCNEARHTNPQYAAVTRLLTGVAKGHMARDMCPLPPCHAGARGTYISSLMVRALQQLVYMTFWGMRQYRQGSKPACGTSGLAGDVRAWEMACMRCCWRCFSCGNLSDTKLCRRLTSC